MRFVVFEKNKDSPKFGPIESVICVLSVITARNIANFLLRSADKVLSRGLIIQAYMADCEILASNDFKFNHNKVSNRYLRIAFPLGINK